MAARTLPMIDGIRPWLRRRPLNAKNLAALGADRLAELLMEVSTGDAAMKRRLRLELAGTQSPLAVAREVRKRLATIGRSRSFVDWQKRKALVQDLETQRRAIVDHVAPADPTEALDLMWRFMGLANSVHDRCEDGGGAVSGVFTAAGRDLGIIAATARTSPEKLAQEIFRTRHEDKYRLCDGLIEAMAPSLGKPGLERLRSLFEELAEASIPEPAAKDRRLVAWSTAGPVYAHSFEAWHRQAVARTALKELPTRWAMWTDTSPSSAMTNRRQPPPPPKSPAGSWPRTARTTRGPPSTDSMLIRHCGQLSSGKKSVPPSSIDSDDRTKPSRFAGDAMNAP